VVCFGTVSLRHGPYVAALRMSDNIQLCVVLGNKGVRLIKVYV